jgi:hypothetical protein
MSETAAANGRDAKTGQFVTGSSGGPGRKVGSRNRLGEAFIEDLKTVWEEDGISALRRCAAEDPGQFCRIVANLLPKDLNVNLTTTNASEFAARFKVAVEMLGNVEPPRLRRPLRIVDGR